GIVNDTGQPDVVASEAHQHAVEDLPDEASKFLLASRYCETNRLSEIAWSLFGKTRRCQVNLSRSEKPEAGYAIIRPRLHPAIRSPLRPERSAALIARRDGVQG